MAYWSRDRRDFGRRGRGGYRGSEYQSIRYPPPPPKPRQYHNRPAKRARSPFNKSNKRVKYNKNAHIRTQPSKRKPQIPSVSFKLKRCILASGNAATPFGEHERLFSGFYDSQLVATFNAQKQTVYLAARKKNTAPFGLNFHIGLLSSADIVKKSYDFELYLEKLEREQEIETEKTKLERLKEEKEKLIEELSKEKADAEGSDDGTFSLEKKTQLKRTELELLETEGQLQQLSEELDTLAAIPEPTFDDLLEPPEEEKAEPMDTDEAKGDEVEEEKDEDTKAVAEKATEDEVNEDDDLIEQMEASERDEAAVKETEDIVIGEPAAEQEEKEEVMTAEQMGELKVAELRELCVKNELAKSGVKKVLVKRLQDHFAEKAEEAEPVKSPEQEQNADETMEETADGDDDDEATTKPTESMDVEVEVEETNDDGDGDDLPALETDPVDEPKGADEDAIVEENDDPIQEDDDVVVVDEAKKNDDDDDDVVVDESTEVTGVQAEVTGVSAEVVDLTLDDPEPIDPDTLDHFRVVFGFKKNLANQVRSSVPAARNAASSAQLVVLDLLKPEPTGFKKIDEGIEKFFSHCCTGLRNTWPKKDYLRHTVGRLLKETVDAKREDHVLKACSNGCGEILRVYEMEHHESKKCQLRLKECLYCKTVVVFKDMKEHITTCTDFPVPCPHNCAVGKVKRKDLDTHVESDCALTMLPCDYQSFGCSENFQRRHHKKHLGDFCTKHLSLVSEAYYNLQEHTSAIEDFLKTKHEDFYLNKENENTTEEATETTEVLEITETSPDTEAMEVDNPKELKETESEL